VIIKILFWTKASLFLLLIIAVNNIVLAQSNTVKQNIELRPPSEESFEKDEQLLMSWRTISCLREEKEVHPPNCPERISPAIYRASDAVTLYNHDGTIWYNFSINPWSPNYLLKNRKEGFLPFSADAGVEGITLRMVFESPNWYEVETNEETQATKFILKNDPVWMKISWNYFLAKVRLLSFDEENQPQLYDKPNGSVIKETSEIKWKDVRFRLKIEGEWAFVEGYKPSTTYQGWVRWRKGRKLLFESNFFKDKFGKQIFNE
jgi:hypothetical protein